MKIAMFAWESAYSINVGGVAVHVSNLAEALLHLGHEVHIFTRMGKDNQPLIELKNGVYYHFCPFSWSDDFMEAMNNMCRSFVDSYFYEESQSGEFDIVHAHDWMTANVLDWIKVVASRRFIFTMHSTEYGRCGNQFWGGNSDAIRHQEWLGMYAADHVIAVSQYLKDEIKWIYSVPDKKIQVIYNGIHAAKFSGWKDTNLIRKKFNITKEDPFILFAGRMVVQKGPDLLIEALPGVIDREKDAKIIFAGDGDMRSHLENLTRQMNIHQAVIFLGNLGGWALHDLFHACDVVCVPSRNEPFGIVILEAWSTGSPVVTTTNGGPSEIVKHHYNGIKVSDNPGSIGDGLTEMISDRPRACWMGENGRHSAQNEFTWELIAGQTLEVYQYNAENLESGLPASTLS